MELEERPPIAWSGIIGFGLLFTAIAAGLADIAWQEHLNRTASQTPHATQPTSTASTSR